MLEKIYKLFYQIIFSISIFTILSALYIEYILSIPACKLCLYQRIPYIFSIVICFLGYFFPKKSVLIYLIILTFFSSVIISGYHIGIENSIFTEFSGCVNENLNTIDKSVLLQNLNSFFPNCKNVNFEIFGTSLATINFILSIALVFISIKYYLYEKNR
tara:strand:+ start:128 stop:604 length:477 start_codon:yes stop_codon:yes gene_type:complete